MFPVVLYTITRLIDAQSFRVRMPRRTPWQLGDLVTVEDVSLETGNG
jgi:hypothetical protein